MKQKKNLGNISYYYNGCPSWGWYYPHHYAPLISDMRNLGQFEIEFEMGEPFYPFEQLLAVLPIASASCLPSVYRKLMTDKNSIICDMYPTDFEIDMNWATVPWEGIALLPFIDAKKLRQACESIDQSKLKVWFFFCFFLFVFCVVFVCVCMYVWCLFVLCLELILTPKKCF